MFKANLYLSYYVMSVSFFTNLILDNIRHLIGASMFLVIGLIVSRMIATRLGMVLTINDDAKKSVISLFLTIATSICLVGALAIMGIPVGILITGSVIGIGLALQDYLSEIIAGIMLITDRRLTIGAVIRFHGPLERIGTIQSMHFRYTCVKRLNGRRGIIPNTIMLQTPYELFYDYPSIRKSLCFVLPKNIDRNILQPLIKKTIASHPAIDTQLPVTVLSQKIGPDGIHVRCRFFYQVRVGGVHQGGFRLKSQLRQMIATQRQQLNLTPFPHQKVNLLSS